jgi:hypothetical protein
LGDFPPVRSESLTLSAADREMFVGK